MNSFNEIIYETRLEEISILESYLMNSNVDESVTDTVKNVIKKLFQAIVRMFKKISRDIQNIFKGSRLSKVDNLDLDKKSQYTFGDIVDAFIKENKIDIDRDSVKKYINSHTEFVPLFGGIKVDEVLNILNKISDAELYSLNDKDYKEKVCKKFFPEAEGPEDIHKLYNFIAKDNCTGKDGFIIYNRILGKIILFDRTKPDVMSKSESINYMKELKNSSNKLHNMYKVMTPYFTKMADELKATGDPENMSKLIFDNYGLLLDMMSIFNYLVSKTAVRINKTLDMYDIIDKAVADKNKGGK